MSLEVELRAVRALRLVHQRGWSVSPTLLVRRFGLLSLSEQETVSTGFLSSPSASGGELGGRLHV